MSDISKCMNERKLIVKPTDGVFVNSLDHREVEVGGRGPIS